VVTGQGGTNGTGWVRIVRCIFKVACWVKGRQRDERRALALLCLMYERKAHLRVIAKQQQLSVVERRPWRHLCSCSLGLEGWWSCYQRETTKLIHFDHVRPASTVVIIAILPPAVYSPCDQHVKDPHASGQRRWCV
jgi:hypothetical protein